MSHECFRCDGPCTSLEHRSSAKLTPGLKRKTDKAEIGTYVRHLGKWYQMIKCNGEAHSNPYIDNCMSCAPLWGRRLVQIEQPAVSDQVAHTVIR